MHVILAKKLSQGHCKATISSCFKITFDTEEAGASESVCCEFRWIRVAGDKSALSDCLVINFECSVIIRRALISEIDLVEP